MRGTEPFPKKVTELPNLALEEVSSRMNGLIVRGRHLQNEIQSHIDALGEQDQGRKMVLTSVLQNLKEILDEHSSFIFSEIQKHKDTKEAQRRMGELVAVVNTASLVLDDKLQT